jgi:hypothetical protein
MPWNQVMSKFKSGKLHSGSKTGPKVTNRKQAIAIMMSEKRSGKEEYKAVHTSPSKNLRRKIGA